MYKIIGADGREYGPVNAEQLRQWVAVGRADGNTRVQLEGTTEWKALREFPEFAYLATVPASFPPSALPSVPNYLVQAILCTLCCCLPLGVVAIVYAAQVNGKLAAGDHAGAQEASKNARMWCWIALGVGVVVKGILALIYSSAGILDVMKNAR